MSRESIRFGGGRLALIGVLAGVAIALGLPWLVLVYGQHLGATVLTIIIIASLLMGGLIALVAAFFGAVIPTVVESKPTILRMMRNRSTVRRFLKIQRPKPKHKIWSLLFDKCVKLQSTAPDNPTHFLRFSVSSRAERPFTRVHCCAWRTL